MLNLVLLLPGILSATTVPAQVRTGQLLYDKLAKTQCDYQAARATGDSEEVAQACYDMGKRYGAFGEYVTAQNWYARSLRIREPHGPSEVIGKTYLRLSENWTHQKQYQLAMRCVRQGMSNVRLVESKHGIMSAYIVLAGVHEMGWKVNREKPGSIPEASLDSSLYYFGQAEQLALELNKPLDTGLVYYRKGNLLAYIIYGYLLLSGINGAIMATYFPFRR